MPNVEVSGTEIVSYASGEITIPTAIKLSSHHYAEMYMYESAATLTINTTNAYHMVPWFTAGLSSSDWSINTDDKSGAITNTADNGSGKLRCTDVAHGLSTDAVIQLTGMGDAAHNGTTEVTVIDVDRFDAESITYNSAADTGTWNEGSYLLAGSGSAGVYRLMYSITAASSAAAKNFKAEVTQNAVHVEKSAAEFTPQGTNHQNCNGTAYIDVSEGDRIFLIVKNETDSNNLELEHCNINLNRLYEE